MTEEQPFYKYQPSYSYTGWKIMGVTLAIIGELLVIGGIFGMWILLSSPWGVILFIPVLIGTIVGLVMMMVVPKSIYLMFMWKTTNDRYYWTRYNNEC